MEGEKLHFQMKKVEFHLHLFCLLSKVKTTSDIQNVALHFLPIFEPHEEFLLGSCLNGFF